jgi:GAF domain-containing protein/HAMP domain-containing protein
MIRFFRRFNVVSWPIWAKLLGGFILAIVIPAILILAVVFIGIREIGEERIESLVTASGSRNTQIIHEQIEQTREQLQVFTEDPVLSQQVIELVVNVNRLTESELDSYFDATVNTIRGQLIPAGNNLFQFVRVLDRNGFVVVSVSSAGAITRMTDIAVQDESQSAAYLEAVNAQISGESSSLTASALNGAPTIEFGQTLYWRDGSVVGYLIGTWNLTNALYTRLTLTRLDDGTPAHIFLVGPNDVVFTPIRLQEDLQASLDSVAVERALQGETGVETYELGETEVIGYYTPVSGTPLALITEVETASPLAQVLDYFGGVRAFAIVTGAILLVGVLVILFNQLLSPPLTRLRQAVQAMVGGNFDEPVAAVSRGDEIGSLAAAFVDMRGQMRDLITDLESRIAMRTRDINATQEISRFAATQRDLQTMMDQVVALIVDRFPNIYHAQIFLIDSNGRYAVLRASTGEIGQRLLARGHRLPVGSVSVIGQVTEQGQLVVARDTSTSRVHKQNEFLPDTRAELAIPLRAGNEVIGALDVQSEQNDAFTSDEINVLQTMADQIAVAIQNASLYQESMRRLEEIEQSNRTATVTAWERYMREQRTQQFTSIAGISTGAEMSELRRLALAQNTLMVGELTERDTVPIAVPIQLRGQTLGAVEWELPVQDFDENKLQLAQELANRLAISLDNARLFQESQRATERERLVSSIAAKLTSQTDIDEILQTAVREVGQALRSPQVSIHLHRTNGHNGSNE